MTNNHDKKLEEFTNFVKDETSNNLAKILKTAVNQLFQAELESYLNAKKYERNEERTTYRSGFRTRKLATSLGELEIDFPKIRKGSFTSSVMEKYQRIDRSLISIVQQAYINGVSTRKMKKLFDRLGIKNLDKSTVSRYIQPIQQEVNKWKSRKLASKYEYIWIDAIYTKVRENGQVRPQAIMIALGLTEDGKREILGFEMHLKEAESSWEEFFLSLKHRGLRETNMWIRDDHDGLKAALTKCFPCQIQQRCIVHWQRNLLDKVPKKDLGWLTHLSSNFVKSANLEEFKYHKDKLLSNVENKGSERLFDWLEETLPEVSNFIALPEQHWAKIKSTNPIERLNEEIRRREKSIRIFPNCESCNLLIGAILVQQNEDWVEGRTYMSIIKTERASLQKKLKLAENF